jgi:hypothetical protein
MEDAMRFASGGAPFHAAILDVNLAGKTVFPVADSLVRRVRLSSSSGATMLTSFPNGIKVSFGSLSLPLSSRSSAQHSKC